MRLDVLLLVTGVAAILGNTVNYAIGWRVAHRLLDTTHGPTPFEKYIKRDYVLRAQAFFATHGGKAVVLARFVPIVRTFLPFVAGGARMPYGAYTLYNVAGCVLWVGVCVGAGNAFGNIPVVKQNFELVVLGIVGVSVLPVVVELLRARSADSH
jgi:membrane-associated protein